MDTTVEVHSVTRSTHRSTSKKPHEKLDLTRVDHITNVITNVKSQLHARLVTSVLEIMKKNEKFRRITQRCFEHIPVMALCMGLYFPTRISVVSKIFVCLQIRISRSIVICSMNFRSN